MRDLYITDLSRPDVDRNGPVRRFLRLAFRLLYGIGHAYVPVPWVLMKSYVVQFYSRSALKLSDLRPIICRLFVFLVRVLLCARMGVSNYLTSSLRCGTDSCMSCCSSKMVIR